MLRTRTWRKMENTFAYRRQEVVRDTPLIKDFQARWPALFEVGEVCDS